MRQRAIVNRFQSDIRRVSCGRTGGGGGRGNIAGTGGRASTAQHLPVSKKWLFTVTKCIVT